MLVIRLARIGKKNHPQYRIVLQEKKKSPKRKALDILGYYHPVEKAFVCDTKKVEEYIKNGVQPSSTMARLLRKEGVKEMEKYIKAVTMKKSKKTLKEEAKAAEEKAKEVPAAPKPETKEETKVAPQA